MHTRAHTGLRSHVTFFHGKRVEEFYTSDSARTSETSALVGPDTHRCGIAGKPNHDTVPPAHAFVYHFVLPCATVVVHARCVRHSLDPAILLPQCRLPLHSRCLPHLLLLLACLNQTLRGRSLGVFREKEIKTCVNVCECTYSPTSIGSLFLFSFCFQLFPDSDFIYQ